jgi:2-succinyl-5-enolpyruvyl-6-hydroxy-3-cyclohexene-1-carboxylate synthase
MLRSPGFRDRFAPDLIVELGTPPTSAGYARYLGAHRDATRVVVAPHGWNDPAGSADALFTAGAALVLAAAALLSPRAPEAWSRAFAEADARAWAVVEDELAGEALTEALVARVVAAACPEGSVLAIGNSSPVRELDAWAPPSARGLTVLHQRGVSGIDGLVSGAAGARSVARAPVTLLLGDVSLLHDLGGLELARRAEGPLAIVVVNNDGGRIFEQLPLAARAECEGALERCFTTPHGLSFEAFARGFGLRYAAPCSRGELSAALDAAHAAAGATLIEVKVPPRDAAARDARLWERVDRALEG